MQSKSTTSPSGFSLLIFVSLGLSLSLSPRPLLWRLFICLTRIYLLTLRFDSFNLRWFSTITCDRSILWRLSLYRLRWLWWSGLTGRWSSSLDIPGLTIGSSLFRAGMFLTYVLTNASKRLGSRCVVVQRHIILCALSIEFCHFPLQLLAVPGSWRGNTYIYI